jgi:hypothetical protein
MPSIYSVFLCSIAGLLFWGTVGFALSRRLAPPSLALPIAPALGWACHSVLALALYSLIGFTPLTVACSSLLSLVIACGALYLLRSDRFDKLGNVVPPWAYALAALLAFLPAIALFPKFSGDTIALAGPIFDHSKVALIDEMTRLGVPPGNPFFGEAGRDGPLAYYYLWHFSAAELALFPGASGWEADIALSAFTAFSSVMLMMGFSVWIGGRAAGALGVAPLAFAASLYPVLEAALGARNLYTVIQKPTGFAGWLFQTTWAPQHTASTSCVVLSGFLLLRLAHRPSALTTITLSLTAAAGYESSTWIGGIVFAITAPVMAAILLMNVPANVRFRFVGATIAAALIAVLPAYPFLHDQYLNAAGRGGGSPLAIEPYPFLRLPRSESLRRALDIPAFWLLFLTIEFPAIYIPGFVSLIGMLRSKRAGDAALLMSKLFCGLALVSLVIAAYLASTLAENNDLGWRAVLPAVNVLTIFAAIGLARWLASPRSACHGLCCISCPQCPATIDRDHGSERTWHALPGRSLFCRKSRAMGRRTSAFRRARARRQQPALLGRCDTLAGQHLLGVVF